MNRFIIYIFFTVICSLVFVSSCKKEEPAPLFHFEYFGLTEGRFIVYDVVEIRHDDQAVTLHDTMRYQLKTLWGQTYIDNEGRDGREFLRYTRAISSDTWMLSDIWYGLIDGNRGELVEENQRRVKLVFAPTSQKEWDANSFNLDEPLECFYDNIHNEYFDGTNFFDSTITIEQGDESNGIDTIRKFEVYAKNIGLVHLFSKDNDYQFTPVPQNGKELYYTFVSSGIE